MKTGRYIIIFLSVAALLASCVKVYSPSDSKPAAELKIKLNIPKDYAGVVDVCSIPVTVKSKRLPLSMTVYPDKDSIAVFKLVADSYDVVASYYDTLGRISVNGFCEEFLLVGDGIANGQGKCKPASLEMNMDIALPSPIVIRELYYHGSMIADGSKTYIKDRYVEIYNNNGEGGDVYYLDSLCISSIFPYNSTSGNNAWKGQDTIALAQFYWTVPGEGTTYPLKPGESVVIALQAAVDHSERCTSGLHLEKSHFGCYDEALSGHEISAGVTSMICNMIGLGTAWAVSIHSPAFILFRPSMGVAEYRRHPEIWEKFEPGKTSGTKYWHIAKEWIIDGVECYDSPTGATKRLPSSVDASYCCMKLPHHSGHCISRKLDAVASTASVPVYMDTNNSANDFNVDMELNPSLKQ